MEDEPTSWWDTPPARVSQPLVFVFANLFAAGTLVALLSLLRERTLLPRYVPWATALLILASLTARFL